MNAALRQATSVPLGVAERAAEVARIAETLKPITNPNMASDLTTADCAGGGGADGSAVECGDQRGIDEGGLSGDDAFMKETRARAAKLRE